MKTTLDLPDDLMRKVRIRAAEQNRRLTDVISELLTAGLAAESQARPLGQRVKLPLIHTTRVPRPEEQLTPERVAQILIDQEVQDLV